MKKSPKVNRIIHGNTFVGFSLGADFCAEHEWGIHRLCESFGIVDKGYGVDRRKIRITPKEGQLILIEKGLSDSFSVLIFARPWYVQNIQKNADLPPSLTPLRKEDSFGAWDNKSFAIGTYEYQSDLKELYEAILKKKAVITLLGGQAFENPGLHILISSRIPTNINQEWESADRKMEWVRKEAEKTGIENRLRKSGKKWFALSPRERPSRMSSEHSVVFWLNPLNQVDNNYGLFTVEQLDEWAINKGPVIKKRGKH